MPTEWPGITIDQFLIDDAAELVRTVPAHSRRLRETVIEGERLKLLMDSAEQERQKRKERNGLGSSYVHSRVDYFEPQAVISRPSAHYSTFGCLLLKRPILNPSLGPILCDE